jgi:hypothetical protein
MRNLILMTSIFILIACSGKDNKASFEVTKSMQHQVHLGRFQFSIPQYDSVRIVDSYSVSYTFNKYVLIASTYANSDSSTINNQVSRLRQKFDIVKYKNIDIDDHDILSLYVKNTNDSLFLYTDFILKNSDLLSLIFVNDTVNWSSCIGQIDAIRRSISYNHANDSK